MSAHNPDSNLKPQAQPNVGAEDLPERPSKTQRKNEALAITDLGRQLVELSNAQLAKIPLPPELAELVRESRQVTAHIARKRQLQFLGKQLRRVDTDEIQAAVERVLTPGRQEAARAKQAEHWRERLLGEGDQALSELLQQYPRADRQQLRQLLRQCQQLGLESPRGKQAARSLYRLVHEYLGG